MKTKNVTTVITVMALSSTLFTQHAKAQDKVEASAGADIVSGYIWRGQDLGGVSLQPAASVAYKGVSLAAWGSVGFESADTKEFDLTLGYAAGGFSLSVTDYWFNKTGDGEKAKYFKYSSDNAACTHLFEAQIGYDFGPLSVNWYTNFAGADGVDGEGDRAYSSYIALKAPFTLGGLDWTAEMGASPWETTLYGSNGFSVCDISLKATKTIGITDHFSLPLFAKATWNPRSEGAYFVAGLSF